MTGIRTLLFIWLSLLTPFHLWAKEPKRTLKIAAVELGPYISEHAEDRGFLHQIIHRVFTDAGYAIELEFYPALRARELVMSGQRDVLVPAFSEKDLERTINFSASVYESQITAIKLKSSLATQKIRHAVARDSSFRLGTSDDDERLNDLYWQTEKTSQLIDMLNLNRIDLALADRLVVADVLIRKRPHLIQKIDFADPPLARRAMRVGFSKKRPDHESLRREFDGALMKIRNSGDYEAILRRYGFAKETAKDHEVLTIGVPKNPDMQTLEELKHHFEKKHPKVKIVFYPMTETFLRRRTQMSVALNDGLLDIFSLGPADIPLYAKNGWLQPIKPFEPAYDVQDLIPIIRESVSYDKQIYTLPFYSETLITYFRSDLFAQAGLKMPARPTFDDIKSFAKRLHKPEQGQYGICLRGKKGWRLGIIAAMAHSYGAQFLDSKWLPRFTEKRFKDAVGLYVELMTQYGPPEITNQTYHENKDLFAAGSCAIWIDATVAASTLFDPKQSSVAGRVAFAESPIKEYQEGARWLWIWSMGISSSSKNKSLALKFLQWATSKEYIALVAKEKGWLAVPPGTRLSTYGEAYAKQAPFGDFVLKAIQAHKPLSEREPSTPLTNTRYLYIPEWPAIVGNLDSHIEKVLLGQTSLESALETAEREAWQVMYQAGYYKSTIEGAALMKR